MSELQRLKQLSEKIERLLETVGKNGDRFSSIDKDLLTNYVRELYELIVGIQPYVPASTPAAENYSQRDANNKSNAEELKVKEEKNELNGNSNGEHDISSKENASKKTISQIYAEKKDLAKSTVNDRFKREGLEIADKLKQTPIKDLKGYIGLNKQFAFMTKLFNADEQLYEKAISRLNTFKSYEEATIYIQSELLPKLNWNDEEPLVAEFFTLIMRRYLN